MAAHDDSDWSDSDDEDLSEIETSVLLGIPDGAIEKQEDLEDAAVSRIGGYPALLPKREPPLSSAQCKHCSYPMELLVQLWCPLEESPYDRALYVWGCARSACQRKEGSVRAFRGLRFNENYAAKLEKKRVRKEGLRKKEVEAAAAKKTEESRRVNPFSLSAATPGGTGLFGSGFGAAPSGASGLGAQLFGAPASESDSRNVVSEDTPDDGGTSEPPASEPEDDSDAEGGTDSDSEAGSDSDTKSEVVAPASQPSAESTWRAVPAYAPAQYLSTSAEYLPPTKSSAGAGAGGDAGSGGHARKGGKGHAAADEWNTALEGYEHSLNVDHAFERFIRRVGCEGEQCIRYELGGTPLPYASDALFSALFPSPTADTNVTVVTRKDPKAVQVPARRMYDPNSSVIKPCPACGGRRVLECQLMPNLINVLRKTTSTSTASAREGGVLSEERKKEVERTLKGGAERGMEWGTCFVFSCEGDCCLEDGEERSRAKAKDCWREELVLVQWEE